MFTSYVAETILCIRDLQRTIQSESRSITQARGGARSLKGKLPVKLAYVETQKTLIVALRREKEIKGWRKEKKEKLIADQKRVKCACAEQCNCEARVVQR